MHINSGNLFVPRRLFIELGGFDETLSSGEDAEFCCRAKKRVKIIADDKIHVVHLGNPKTIELFLKREIWHGIGATSSLRHNWFDKPFLGTVAFALFFMLQLIGIVLLIYVGYAKLFVWGMFGVICTVAATVLYRIMNGASLRNSWALFILYCVYYFGRAIALGMTVAGRGDYQRTR
jgi:GT2 family glycosyltransferase